MKNFLRDNPDIYEAALVATKRAMGLIPPEKGPKESPEEKKEPKS